MDKIEATARYVLRKTADRHVVVGPVVWRPSDGLSARCWYFIVSAADRKTGWRCDSIQAGSREEAEMARRALMLALTRRRPPVVVHDTDDELYCMRLCEALWPGERVAKVRAEIEAERCEQSG